MNKDLKDLIINCEKEMKNHNPTPLRVCVLLKRLIEDHSQYLLREPHFGKTSFRYLKEKMYSMFKFKTIVQVERI